MRKKAKIENAGLKNRIVEGSSVRFQPTHPLYAGQSAVVTQRADGASVIVELQSGDRIHVSDWHLSPQCVDKTDREYLSLNEITIDGGTQSRACLNEATVDEYAEAMDGGDFPPVLVFYDGEKYWLSDGFHRLAAAKKLEWGGISAEIRQGTRREAVLYSVGANATHGLRRTNADKRRAVMTLLGDEEWREWSDREIARCCKVSNNFVSSIRRSLSSDDSEKDRRLATEHPAFQKAGLSARRTYVTKHGTEATMNTAKIGSRSSSVSDTSNVVIQCSKEEVHYPPTQLPRREQHLEVPPGERPHARSEALEELAIPCKPDAVAQEISMGMRNLTPEELAWAITNSANFGLSDDHLKAVIKAAKQALNVRHHPDYFKEETR